MNKTATEKPPSLKEVLADLVIVVGVMFLTALANAYVVRSMWEWFVVPLGAPPVGAAHAYGIALVVSYLSKSVDRREMEEARRAKGLTYFFKRVFESAIHIAVAYAFARLAHWIMVR